MIRAIVRKGELVYGDEMIGFLDAWDGVREQRWMPLDVASLRGMLPRGGTLLGTRRGSPYDHTAGLDQVRAAFDEFLATRPERPIELPSSQVMIVSKGGTNSLHGSLFEYFRNSVLDARNFFDRKTALTPDRLPNFVRNNFGGSVGGPIRKDTLFYYTVFETLKDRLGTTQVASVKRPVSTSGSRVISTSKARRSVMKSRMMMAMNESTPASRKAPTMVLPDS